MTQKAAALAAYWSVSKILRIEQGTVPVAPGDVRALLHAYGVDDQERIDLLMQLAIEARTKKADWVEYEGVFSPAALQLFAFEAYAAAICKHESSVVPGLFQTREYAESLALGLGSSPQRTARLVEVRLLRQEILSRENRPSIHFILGEAALQRVVGDSRLMVEQLRRLQQLSDEPGITLQIVPFQAGPYAQMDQAFTILQFDQEDLEDLLYLESSSSDWTTRNDQEIIDQYLESFVRISELALSDAEVSEFIEEVIRSRFPHS